MMLKEENLLLKSGRYCRRWLSVLPQSFFPDAWMEGTELFQFFDSLCQRSGANYKISCHILSVEG